MSGRGVLFAAGLPTAKETTMPSDNPYLASTKPYAEPVFDVPEELLKKIKHAWIAALISGTITLVVTLLAISGQSILGFSAWELIDVAIIFSLAFGIFKKSRTCAVLMLTYFIISKIILMMEQGKPTGIVMALVFIYFYWQGVTATFAYHKLKKEHRAPGANGVV